MLKADLGFCRRRSNTQLGDGIDSGGGEIDCGIPNPLDSADRLATMLEAQEKISEADWVYVETIARQAVAYFRHAGDNGHARAARNVGVMYEEGIGVKQDHYAAEEWYGRAIELGEADGFFRLAMLQRIEGSVNYDPAAALGSLEAAIELGHVAALRELGLMCDLYSAPLAS